MDNYKIYRNEKNRQDRLRAQRKYYYKHRERILAHKRQLRREKEESSPTRPTVVEKTLIEMYHHLGNYLRARNLLV